MNPRLKRNRVLFGLLFATGLCSCDSDWEYGSSARKFVDLVSVNKLTDVLSEERFNAPVRARLEPGSSCLILGRTLGKGTAHLQVDCPNVGKGWIIASSEQLVFKGSD